MITKMEGLNPDEMAGSFDYSNYQGGYVQTNRFCDSQLNESKKVISDEEKLVIFEKIKNYQLSDEVKYFVDKYEKIIGERDVFLWKWLGPIFNETGVTLSTVNSSLIPELTHTKIIMTMFATILDDVADSHQDKKLLNAMIDSVLSGKIKDGFENNEKVKFLLEAWNHIISKIEKYPRYEEFKDIFMYDVKQLLNCINYSCLTNENPHIVNLLEMQNYDCHNMVVFLYNGLDIMASPELDKNELPHLRTAFWYAQQMARIGNWLSTWKREIKEGDISSGVFGYLFSNNIISMDDVKNIPNEELINRIEKSEMKEYFLGVWKENHNKLSSMKEKIHSVNIDSYVNGLENVIKFHMASEGLK